MTSKLGIRRRVEGRKLKPTVYKWVRRDLKTESTKDRSIKILRRRSEQSGFCIVQMCQ